MWIHSCNSPVCNTKSQKQEGDDGIEQCWHDAANRPVEKRDITFKITFDSFLPGVFTFFPSTTIKQKKETYLLPSFRRAMAIRTLFRRNIRTKMMIASMTAKEITAEKYQAVSHFHQTERFISFNLNVQLHRLVWNAWSDLNFTTNTHILE